MEHKPMFSTVHYSSPKVAALTVAGAVAALLSLSAAAAPGTPATQVAPAGPQGDVMFYSATGVGCGPGGPGGPGVAQQFQMRVTPPEPQADAVNKAPYSAVGSTEVVNQLADGNRIVRTNTMKYYRDGSGRTRTEYSLAAIGPFTPDRTQTIVTIVDPVAGERYVLNSAMKRADVFKLSGGGMPPAGARTGFFFNRVEGGATVSGTVVNTDVVTNSPTAPPVMVTSGSLDGPAGNAMFVMRAAPMPVGTDGCKIETKPLPEARSLGERTIEGLKVTGSRREFTIEAGSIGNEQPIVVSTEQWFSPDLGVVVASSHHDPMIGDTNYKLTQISRAEPDPALFKVPADFTRQEVPVMNFKMEKLDPGAPPPQGRTQRIDTTIKPAAYTGK
jgi:hypothetical protein